MSDAQNQKRAPRTWTKGLVSVLTVLVAPLLIAIIPLIWTGYFQPKDRLEAEVQVNDFAYPPQVYAFGESFKSALSRDSLLKLLTNDKWLIAEPAIKEIADRIALAFSDLSIEFNYGFARLTDAMGIGEQIVLRITMFNSGETTLEGVRLEISDILASQYKRGGKAFITGKDQIIDIGEMRIGEKVVVTAWKRWFDPKISLTHKGGKGTVNLMVPIRADSWSYKFYKLSVLDMALLFLPLAWGTGFLLLLVVHWRRRPGRRVDAGKVSTGVEPDIDSGA